MLRSFARGGAGTGRAATSEQVERVRASGLFDPAWYVAHYPDVARAGVDPLQHFMRSGAAEGRNPGPRFDTIYYLSENPALQAAGLNPLLYYLEHGSTEMCRPLPLTDAQRFESFGRSVRSGALSGERLHGQFHDVHYSLAEPRGDTGSDGLPLPPLDLAVRIGAQSLSAFEIAGREAKQTLVRCLPAGFSFAGARCLDFGCGIGRVIRHFRSEAETAEFWGCDIDGTSTRWCAENLSPPFSFFQLGHAPILPLESSSFDFVYALGVFNQLYDEWQMFAMEIRRILKPGGVFFMSFNGQTPYEEMFEAPYAELIKSSGMVIRNPFNGWNNGGPTIAHAPAWIQEHWGSLFDIDYIAMEGLLDYGSICMMRKPEAGPSRRRTAPVVALATSQAFNPNARGKIKANPDLGRPYLDSYGVQGRGTAQIGGWIAFRGDTPAAADLSVDGVAVPSATTFAAGVPYRDWDTPQTAFLAQADLSGVPAGRHELAVEVTSQRGLSHRMTIPLTVLD